VETFFHKHVNELTSTNEYLWELSEKQKLEDFYTISAGFQNSGKGQDDNVWESAKDKNILLSIIVNPSFLLAENVFQISRWVSLAIVGYLKEKGLRNIQIKWPNDIYIDDKKIAGILIQNAMLGHHISKSMIGIGLNINQTVFVSDAPNPVSLKQLTQQDYSVNNEISSLIKHLQKNYRLLMSTPQQLIQDYHELLYQRDQWRDYQIGEEIIKGMIKGVDQFGRLVLEKSYGNTLVLDIKEVRFL
jgi:BirA family biotin operon repressor/biotin-[acetyl-CoA-carboxylase] ligase